MKYILSALITAVMLAHAGVVFAATPVADLFVVAVNSQSIDFTYTNLPKGTKILLEAPAFFDKPFNLGVIKGDTGTMNVRLPTLKFGTMFTLNAYTAEGLLLATSQSFQAGGFAKDAPSCTIALNRHKVNQGESVSLNWNSPRAASVYKSVGFDDGPQQSMKKRGKMTLRPGIPGLRQYALVFGASSGNQSACAAFVKVVGQEQTIRINDRSLNSTTLRPVLSGTATNVGWVKVSVSAQTTKFDEFMWISKPVMVRGGAWSIKVPQLPKTHKEYVVEVFAYDKGQYGVSERQTLLITQ